MEIQIVANDLSYDQTSLPLILKLKMSWLDPIQICMFYTVYK